MNGGKDIKIGDDKRVVSVIPKSQRFLFNIANGELLTDEFGTPLIVEVDEYFIQDSSSERATSTVFTTQSSGFIKKEYVSIAQTTATYSEPLTNQIGINTTNIFVGDIVKGSLIPDATQVSRIGVGIIYISNRSLNTTSPKTEIILVLRNQESKANYNPVLKIEEQFSESSEVSTSLLGIDRAEVQLGLFSNVSSYGLDSDEFEFYSFNSGNSFGSWEQRKNAIFGERYNAKQFEETQESAIRLAAFPTPYSFPFGPKFAKLGLYDQATFQKYLNFIQLGNELYNYYKNQGYGDSWINLFLSPEIAVVGSGGDVVYKVSLDIAFAQIDTWTDTWRDLTVGITIPGTGDKLTFTKISTFITGYNSGNTRPGYTSGFQRYAYLQSRRVFRYQPGRISGFTFGLKSSAENQPGIQIEWGISNPTDQFVFKVASGQLSIVRRSTVPLEKSVLERNGLSLSDQVKQSSGDPFDSVQYWTIDIPRDKFNGDPLNSNGPSGYLLNIERVTMYKIEFGWYGAIGARFYAYIPTDNGDARWVVIHTLVIENSLSQPCLQDSYFRFKYSLNVTDTADIRTPQFLYKYGASYYIDGGDEGNSTIYSTSSGSKTITSSGVRSLIGIKPKEKILNSEGKSITNKKLIIPTSVNVSTDCLTEVNVVTCKGCPDFGYVYTPGLATTESGRYVDIEFSSSNSIDALNNSYFTSDDIGAKLIAPSIYNAYIVSVSNPVGIGNSFQTAQIKGFSGTYGFTLSNRNIPNSLVYDRVLGVTTTIGIGSTYPYPVRLSNYNAVAASEFGFTGSKIEVQFLNPNAGDSYAHFADFLVGFTDKKPDVSNPSVLNGFIIPGAGTTTILSNDTLLFAQHSHSYAPITEEGVEYAEGWSSPDPPLLMGIDYRIPSVTGISGGICSKLTLEVLSPTKIQNVNEYNYEPNPFGYSTPDPQGRRWIEVLGSFPNIDFNGGQVALLGAGNTAIITDKTFVGVTSSYVGSGNSTFSYIQVSGSLNAPSSNFTVLVRPVQITAKTLIKSKLYNFNPFPLYLVIKLKDYAQINNITVKETIGQFQRVISPRWYINDKCTITNASGNADIFGAAPTNFKEVDRLSSSLIDNQNQQTLRPFTVRDTFYIGSNSSETIDMKKIFGPDRNVVTPDNNNIEATFITARKIDGAGSGLTEISLNYKEQ